MSSPITLDEIGVLALLLAEKTALGALCSSMEIRAAVEFLNGRGYLRRPPEDHVTPTRKHESP
jgi:hypothetical protein